MENLDSQYCSLKVKGKPTLFSFGLETEFKYIEKRFRGSQRDFQKEEEILKQLAIDWVEIIKTKILTKEHLHHLEYAITEGGGGIWEPATSKLEVLAYHFDNAKEKIKCLIRSSRSKIIIRSLTMLSDAFTLKELKELLKETLNHKSKRVRSRAAGTALDLRSNELINLLEERKLIESEKEVLNSLEFAIENMHQPKGGLTFPYES